MDTNADYILWIRNVFAEILRFHVTDVETITKRNIQGHRIAGALPPVSSKERNGSWGAFSWQW